MRWPGWKTVCRQLPRRLCAGVTLLAYLAAVVGLPLPAQAKRKDRSQPYPCMDNPCGCLSAEDCWRGCCCLTPEQRWAWAREHGVTPPPYAERPRTTGWRTTRLRDRAQGKPQAVCQGPCCSGQGRPVSSTTSNRRSPSDKPRNCCQHKPGQPGTDPSASARGGARWALGASALHCRGLSTLWASTGAAVPPAPPAAWSPFLYALGWLPCRHDRPLALSAAPLDPPPRLPSA